jgi:hypothetical protein
MEMFTWGVYLLQLVPNTRSVQLNTLPQEGLPSRQNEKVTPSIPGPIFERCEP